MYSINIKGKVTPKDKKLVKLEIIFFQTGYNRVSKVLNITGPIKDWDNASQSFISKTSDAIKKNKILLDLKLKYQRIAEEWEEEGRKWRPAELALSLDKKKEKEVKEEDQSLSLSQMIDYLIIKFSEKEKEKNGKIVKSLSSVKDYKIMKKALEEFTRKKYNKPLSVYYFSDITKQFLLDFVLFTQKKGIANGNKAGLNQKLRKLRAIVNYAKGLNMYGADPEIFGCVEDKMKWHKFEPKTVSKRVIQLIENVDRSLFSPIEQLHLDLFLFSYYTGGMANVDVCHLTHDLIQGNQVIYERMKFPKIGKPLLIDKSKRIIEKYKGQCIDNYVFPVFTRKHTTEAKMRNRVIQISDKVSKTLTKVCEILDIKENITWYSARGTFISRMVDAGCSPAVAAEQAGNSIGVIFKHYYKYTEGETLLTKMNSVF